MITLIVVASLLQQSQPIQLMSRKDLAATHRLVPLFENNFYNGLFTQPDNVMWYTGREIKQCFQEDGAGRLALFEVNYDLSGGADQFKNNKGEGFGQANREFPWKDTAGITDCKNVSTIKFIKLPPDQRDPNKVLPIVWWKQRFRYSETTIYSWVYPNGTIVGELLLQKDSESTKYCFEVRIRIKRNAEWHIDVLRPDLSRYVAGTVKKDIPNTHPDRVSFRDALGLAAIEDVSQKESINVLNGYFKSAFVNDLLPTRSSSQKFGVVPANYFSVRADNNSCARCHIDTLRHTDEFDNKTVYSDRVSRQWYGRVRGSDGIFSFDIFDNSSKGRIFTPIKLRRDFIKNGIIEEFSSKKHRPPQYLFTRGTIQWDENK